MKPAQTRIFWVDCLRAFSIFLVIVIHFSPGILTHWQNPPTLSWWIANAYDSFARISVPLFVLLSGSLLLGKSESIGTFFKKRMSRVLFPWIVWLVITWLVEVFLFKNTVLLTLSGRDFFSQFVKNSFWFIPLLLELYLITPILRMCIQSVPKNIVWLLASGWIIIVGMIEVWCYIGGQCLPFSLPIGFQYLGLFVAGYVLTQLPNKQLFTRIATFSWMIGYLVTLIGTFYLSRYQGSFSEALYQYTALPVVLSAMGAFMVVKNTSKLLERKITLSLQKKISKWSQFSLEIFLCHALIIKMLISSPLAPLFNFIYLFPLIGIPFFAGIIFLLSYGVTLLLQGLSSKIVQWKGLVFGLSS